MAVPYIMPLGFIDQPNETGATFILTNPEDSLGLRPGTPVTVWRYANWKRQPASPTRISQTSSEATGGQDSRSSRSWPSTTTFP